MTPVENPNPAPAQPSRLGIAGILLALCTLSSHADLVHRWSFDNPAGNAPNGTTFPDSISGSVATVIGQYNQVATLDGSALRLPGTSNGNHSLGFMSPYLNLPNGIISSKTNLSVEIWATPHSVTNFDRLFSFGSANTTNGPGAAPGEIIDINGQGSTPGATAGVDYIYQSLAVVANGNAQRMDATIAGSATGGFVDSALATAMGTPYYYALTFADGVGSYGASGGRLSWYRDGVLIHTRDVDFHLNELNDVNNWLGRSQWTNDWNANASYHEVRIYNHALSTAEIANNLLAGPDSFEDPDTDDDGLLDVAFEDHYFGNDDGTATPAELALYDGDDNPDGDAYTNLEEQQLGTDPTDPLSPPPPPDPDHLWTFTVQADSTADSGTVFVDEIGGSWEVTLLGNGGALDGSAVILPGSTNGNQSATTIAAYLDLSDGIISDTADLTIEAWATPISSKNWQRLFDFGRCVETSGPGADPGEIVDSTGTPGATSGYDNLSLTLNNGNDFNTQQLEGEYDDNGPVFTTSSAATTAGVEYHYVMVVQDGVGEFGAAGCRVSWYRDGTLQNTDDFNFRLVDVEDVNNWIGRSMYSADSNSNLALNELRLYRRAITPAEIVSSYNAGPDPSVGPPEPPAPAPFPARRWDFNSPAGAAPAGTAFTDVATGEIATIRGNNATLTGSRLTLPGGTNGTQTAAAISAYLELPNGFLDSYDSMTVEAWITPHSSRTWQRVWDFGNCTVTHGTGALPGEIIDGTTAPAGFQANDNLFLSMNNNNTFGSHRLGGKINAGGETNSDTDLSTITSANTEYHFVMTVEDGAGASGSAGCVVKWYRDSVLYGTIDLPFRLDDIEDVNNWIGRSNWSGDQNSNMSINELRVYNRAITQQEINTSFGDGPNTVYPAPTANDDSATIHAGQKVVVDVLANDTDGPLADTLEIVTAPAGATISGGKIRYAHDGTTNPAVITYRVSGIGGLSNTATVTVNVTDELRITDATYNVPLSPPATAIGVEPAFPGLLFNQPVGISPIPGDTERLLVAEIGGRVMVIPNVTDPAPTSATVLDLTTAILNKTPGAVIDGWSNNECGLLSVACHPDFADNGYLFVSYTVNAGGTHYQRLSRFTVPPEEINDPTPVADPLSEVILISQLDQGANHQGGDMHFGSDGYLYIAYGDEENPNDFRLNSQRIDKDFFAAMLRIDVDKLPGNLEPNTHAAVPTDGNGDAYYSVPADNPWVGATEFLGATLGDPNAVRSEFWAVGLRSPWRFSFDPETDDLWVGDVGQDRYEEVDVLTAGGNYGWVFREGAHDINTNNAGWPAMPADFATTAIDPVYDYVHNAMVGDPLFKGNSVTGGVVYRGSRIPSLEGSYIFGDQVSGHVWSLVRNGGNPPVVTRIAGLPSVAAFGVDPSNGDVLMTAIPANRPNSNTYEISRLVSSDALGTFPQTLSETGIFADVSDLSPSPGVLPYEPLVRFWSDFGIKRRWFSIPGATGQMTWSKEGAWDYPEGEFWVKHFDIEAERGNPTTKKRVETRVLVRNSSGVFGVSYRWNDAETEAYLVADGGVGFPIDVMVEGVPTVQNWQIPSRAQCVTCHNPAAGHALSFNTRQLNQDGTIHGFSGNQIELLHAAGYISNTPDPVETLPAHVKLDDASAPLEQRVRTYFDVNCGYCHQPGGGGPGWDGRAALTLAETGIIHGPVAAAENPGDELVVPGDPTHSVILSRVAETNGYTRMPPLATSELDQEAIDLLTDWIQNELPNHPLYDDWALNYPGLGAPGDDDDGDGVSNGDERLLGTNPLAGDDPPVATLTPAGLEFERKAFRIYDIQTSINLFDWESWNVPENVRSYGNADLLEVIPIDPEADANRYFRFEVTEP